MSGPPNILLIMTDQQRFDSLGCCGAHLAQTPVADRLAAEGVRFRRAFTPCTVCSPARASLFSGRYPHEHGVTGNGGAFDRSLPNLAGALHRAGYRLGYSGKWHIDNEFGPTRFGFEGKDWLGYSYPAGGIYARFLAGSCLHPVNHYMEYLQERGLPVPTLEEAFYRPANPNMEIFARQTGPVESSFEHYVAEEAGEVLDRFAARGAHDGRPFFLWVNFWGPHTPYILPEPWFSMFDPDAVVLSKSMAETFDGKPWQQKTMATHYWGSDRIGDDVWRQAVARYAAYCAYLDWEMGRLLARLRTHAIEEHTVVLFTSDHGSMVGHHRLIDKGPYAYDDIQRIPLIVSGPGVARGSTCDEFVYLHDITRTLLDLARAEPFDCANAQSLVPALRGGRLAEPRTDLYMTRHAHPYPYEQRFLRTDRYTYAFNACDVDELYDLHVDPDQMINRAGDPAFSDVLREMKDRLHAHMAAHADPLLQCFNVWGGRETGFTGMPGSSR